MEFGCEVGIHEKPKLCSSIWSVTCGGEASGRVQDPFLYLQIPATLLFRKEVVTTRYSMNFRLLRTATLETAICL